MIKVTNKIQGIILWRNIITKPDVTPNKTKESNKGQGEASQRC
jgi:hypothetical protein